MNKDRIMLAKHIINHLKREVERLNDLNYILLEEEKKVEPNVQPPK